MTAHLGRAALLALAASTVLVLAGCGDGIRTGIVTSKDHSPAQDIPRVQCIVVGKNPCVPVTVVDHYNENWRLNLRDGDKAGWVDVDQATYGRYDVGGHYPDPR